MPCYICLEEDGVLMPSKGCECKGSIEIHASCLQEWFANTENPFQCSVCKTDFKGTFLTNFMSMEDIMFHGYDEEEDDDLEVIDQFDFHGIPAIELNDGFIIFKSMEHKSIYDQTLERQFRDLKYQSRRQHHHQPSRYKQPIKNQMRQKVRSSRY
jgi:hypothetical protein